MHGWIIRSIPSMHSVLKPVKLSIKEIIHPKMKMCGKCTLPQAILDEYVSSLEQIWSNWTWQHLLTNGSSAVNGCRQNESSNNWYYDNITKIHFKLLLWLNYKSSSYMLVDLDIRRQHGMFFFTNIVIFLSAVWTQRIHWWASDAIIICSKSFLMTN